MNPGDLPGLPVEQLAQFLLGCAREDPTLLARSNSGPILQRVPEVRVPEVRVPLGQAVDVPQAPVDVPRGPVDALPRPVAQPLRLRPPVARNDPELEELVSIAVACARRAEDAVQHAREISWMARRRMTVVAAVTGAGVLAASAVGILDRYHANGDPLVAAVASGVAAASGTAIRIADSGPVGSSPGIGQASAPIAAPGGDQVAAPIKSADRSPVPATAPVAAEVSPPIRSAAVAPASNAAPAVAEVSPPARSAAMAPVSNPAPAVPEARVQVTSPDPARASTGRGETTSGEASSGPAIVAASLPPVPDPAPIGQPGVVAASVDVSPLPQASHGPRHSRRPTRRVTYYSRGPSLLLAQVVYGVRRNLYEIFH